MVIFLVPFLLALIVYSVYSFVQLNIFVINLLGFSGYDWFTTGNFWAWVVVFFGILIVSGIARVIFGAVRYVLVLAGGGVGALLAGKRERFLGTDLGIIATAVITFIVALVLAIAGVVAVTNFTSANPGLTDYFVRGNWFGSVAIFLTFAAILLPKSKTKAD